MLPERSARQRTVGGLPFASAGDFLLADPLQPRHYGQSGLRSILSCLIFCISICRRPVMFIDRQVPRLLIVADVDIIAHLLRLRNYHVKDQRIGQPPLFKPVLIHKQLPTAWLWMLRAQAETLILFLLTCDLHETKVGLHSFNTSVKRAERGKERQRNQDER
jgi:hypothetical protein